MANKSADLEGEALAAPDKGSFGLQLTVALLAVGAVCSLAAAFPAHALAIAILGDVLAVMLAIVLRIRLRGELRRLEQAIGELPGVPSELPHAGEFAPVFLAVQAASERLTRRLSSSQADRQQLEALLNSMQDSVVAVDASGRILWTNERMQRLIPESSVTSPVRVGHALVQTVRDPEVLACVRNALDERAVCEQRTTTLIPGRIFEVNASPMPGGGAVVVLHDVTRVEQMERAQRDFVANVSHELRTPLTSISGYVETLLDHEQSLSPVAREFLGTTLKNSTRMNRLVEDLLTMARVESPENELHPAPIQADVLVRDAVQALAGLVQDEQAELEIGETTPAHVMVDSDSMLQVLGNLIENGIKYGRGRHAPQSRVVVSAREMDGPDGTGSVEFSVRDFGPGIASEHLQRIFERFYRVDKARSRESGGTGLGLAIARHMVESQGGAIRAESELNEGSNFIVTLPRAEVKKPRLTIPI
ncbi:MAG TPA: ATP-binding protein [Acidobacteriaceae bacterium]|nr:ATP-binding protein [Acidobacteriaceae bacterium]